MKLWVIAIGLVGCGHPKDEVAEQQAQKPLAAVPLAGGDTFDPTRSPACLVGTLAELKKHPHWMVRIDEKTSFVPNIDAPPRLEAQIERDATGAVWHDGWKELAKATTAIDAQWTLALDAALAKSCVDPDGGDLTEGDIRWFEIGYGPGETSVIQLPIHSEVTLALAPVFDAARAKHVAEQLPHARSATVEVAGKRWSGKAWRKWSTTIALSSFSDAEVVEFADWAAAQPETLPADPMTVSGTFTIDGVARPIAITLNNYGDRWNIEWNRVAPFKPLWELYGANYMHPYE